MPPKRGKAPKKAFFDDHHARLLREDRDRRHGNKKARDAHIEELWQRTRDAPPAAPAADEEEDTAPDATPPTGAGGQRAKSKPEAKPEATKPAKSDGGEKSKEVSAEGKAPTASPPPATEGVDDDAEDAGGAAGREEGSPPAVAAPEVDKPRGGGKRKNEEDDAGKKLKKSKKKGKKERDKTDAEKEAEAIEKVRKANANDPVKTAQNVRPLQLVEDEKEDEQVEVRKSNLLANPPNYPAGSTWQGEIYLGGGGMGVAYLYYQLDSQFKITDTVVVKDTYVSRLHWGSLHHWYGNPHEPAEREHMEIKAMTAIRRQKGSDKCVHLRHAEQDDDQMSYRIYMNLCPHASLHDLVNKFYSSDKVIPEPAIWWFFECLTEACLLMGYGAVEERDAPEGWEPIVHRDMKPPNIFLDEPKAKGPYPSYPVAKLGDFGIAIMTDDKDAMNPHAYNYYGGTACWKPPEQEAFVDPDTKLPASYGNLGNHTNVWAIGAIIIRMMNQEIRPWSPIYGVLKDMPPPKANETAAQRKKRVELNATKGARMPTSNANAKEKYSQQLRDLAERCVEFMPNDRIGLRELRDEILRNTTSGASQDLSEGMRTESKESEHPELALSYQEDEYKIGFAVRQQVGNPMVTAPKKKGKGK